MPGGGQERLVRKAVDGQRTASPAACGYGQGETSVFHGSDLDSILPLVGEWTGVNSGFTCGVLLKPSDRSAQAHN